MEFLLPLLDKIVELPWFAQVIFYVGFARVLIKPLMTLIDTYIEQTPNDSDNKMWNSVKESKIFKGIVFVIDWLSSIKVKK